MQVEKGRAIGRVVERDESGVRSGAIVGMDIMLTRWASSGSKNGSFIYLS